MPRHAPIFLTLLIFLLAGIFPASASLPSSLGSSSLASCALTHDMQGNTAGLTNQAGTLIDRINYTPYGSIRYRMAAHDTPFLFGGFFGIATDGNDLVHMRARYYNPLTMRFLTSDPAQDGWNWYAYANGNPMGFADPTGYGASSVLNALQTGLSMLGFVPGVGAVADVINAGISAARGDYIGAGFSLAAAVPLFGDFAAAGRAVHSVAQVSRVSHTAAPVISAARVESFAANSALAGSARTVNPLSGMQNCVNCAKVMDTRLSGVKGGTAALSNPQPISNLGTNWTKISGQAEVEQILASGGNGTRGIIYGYNPGQTGHVWNAVNQKSGINFIDAQSGGGGAKWFQEYSNFQFLKTN